MMSTRQKLASIFLVFLIFNLSFTKAEESLSKEKPTPEIHLRYAEGAAKWLNGTAIEEKGEYRWPNYEELGKDLGYFHQSLYYGSAGRTIFFLNLYKVTADKIYRKLAKGTAKWMINEAIKEKGGFTWKQKSDEDEKIYKQAGLYIAAAGIGTAFLELYLTFGSSEYLKFAKGAADWIIATSEVEGDKCHWNSGTDIISGVAGIGLFLIRIGQKLENEKYIEYAKMGGNWLISEAIQEGNGYKWKASRKSERIHPNFSHGTSGVSFYLAKLHKVTNEKKFLDYAKEGGKWLIEHAVEEGGGCKWFHHEPDGKELFYTGWCHGPAGTCRLFMILYDLTKNPLWMDYVKKGAKWIMWTNVPYAEHPGFWNDGMCCGAAGIGEFFIDLYDFTSERSYLQYAKSVAEYLMRKAVPSKDGYKWPQSETRVKPENIYSYTGYSQGAAGIGLFLLKLYAAEKNLKIKFSNPPDKIL